MSEEEEEEINKLIGLNGFPAEAMSMVRAARKEYKICKDKLDLVL